MPVEAHVQLDKRQLKEYEQALSAVKNGVPKVQSWAIQKTTDESRKRIVRAIGGTNGVLAVSQKKIYQKNNTRRPIQQRTRRRAGHVVGGQVTIDKGRIPLGRFSPAQQWKKGSTQGRVRTRTTYKIKAAGGRLKLDDAFLVEFPSGYKGIFRRENESRLPLYQLHGPSIPEVAENNAAVQRVFNSEAGNIYLAKVSERTQYLLERV